MDVPDSRFRFDAILGCCCCCCDCCCNITKVTGRISMQWVGWISSNYFHGKIISNDAILVCISFLLNLFFCVDLLSGSIFTKMATQTVVNIRITIRTFHLLFTFNLYLIFCVWTKHFIFLSLLFFSLALSLFLSHSQYLKPNFFLLS